MLPDIRSIMFTGLLAVVACLLVAAGLWHQSRRTYRGTELLLLDFAAQVSSLLLILARGRAPDWASIVLANSLVCVGSLLGYIGLQRFIGLRTRQAHNWVIVVVFTAIHAYFALVRPNLAVRNVNLAVATTLIWGQCAWLMLIRAEAGLRRVTWAVGLVFALYCLVNFARIAEFFLGAGRQTDFLLSGTFDRVVLLAYQSLFILLTFSLVLMVNQRLILDVAAKEAKFSKAFRSSPYAITLTRFPDGRIVEVNEGFVAISGYPYDEAVGRTTSELKLWANDADRLEAAAELASAGRLTNRERQFRTRSGTEITGLISVELMDIDGQPHALTSINDITTLKRAESALRASEERHRVLLSSLGDAVIATDGDGRIAFANPVAESLTGWTSAEACGRPLQEVFQVVEESTRSPIESPVVRVLREGRVVAMATDTVLLARDRTERPIADSAAPIRDDRGAVVGVVLVFRDRTAERAAQRALVQAAEQRLELESIINRSPAIAFLRRASSGWPVEYVSDNVRQLGYEPADFLTGDRSFASIIHGDDLARVVAEVDDRCSQAACQDFQLHYRLRSATGIEVWVDERTFVRRASDGTVTHLQGILLDVSELRRERLEREALQASLAQSDRLASMGLVAAGVAHEINNPLSFVLYNLGSLIEDVPKLAEAASRCRAALAARGGADDPAWMASEAGLAVAPEAVEDLVDRLREALSGSERIQQISRGLATFSRVERTELTPVDVRTCLEHALAIASNEIKFRALVVREFSALPPVLASEGKLAQVFLNLLINAAHAIEPGHADRNEIRLRTWCEAARVCIEIADTGAGIAPEHRERLFDPFFTTKPVGVGSGLGLWITRNLVQAFGGEIRVTSTPGQGSTFTVLIPAAVGETSKRIDAAAKQDGGRAVGRRRILVVDDEAGIRGVLARVFGRDHDVVMAVSGAEGRSILEQDPVFDIILCDLMMPRMSGMDLHAWIAARHPALASRVVFITGGAFTPGAAEYLARAGNPCVQKPFNATALQKLVHHLLEAGPPGTSRS